MKTKILLLLFAVFSVKYMLVAQVAINDNGAAPNSHAILDIDVSTNDKGVLIPRLTTAERTNMSLTATEEGLTVYDEEANAFYYWDGSAWKQIVFAGSHWSILGNSGIDPNVNFLGTTDSNDLVIKTYNTERMRVLASGNIGIRTSTPDAPLHVYGDDVDNINDDATYDSGTGLIVVGNVNARNLVIDQNEILARNNGASSSLYLQNLGGPILIHYDRPVETHDDGSQIIITDDGKVGIGFLNPTDKLHIYGPLPYLRFTDKDGGHEWNIGVNGAQQRLQIGEDDGTTYYPYRFVIKEGGFVGIGTTSPEGLLHIKAEESQDAKFLIDADQGDDASDTWSLTSVAASNNLEIHNGANFVASFSTSGFFGLGTQTPAKILHIRTSVPYIRFEDTDDGSYWETGNSNGEFRFYEGTSIRFEIDQGGNVGIGTATNDPMAKFHVVKSGTPQTVSASNVAVFQNNENTSDSALISLIGGTASASALVFGYAGKTQAGKIAYDNSANKMTFWANDNQAITVNSDGNVTIGTSAAAEKLQVDGAIVIGNTTTSNAGAIKFDGSNFLGYNGSAWVPLDVQTTSGGGWTDDGTVVRLTTTSDKVGIGTNSPSAKLEVAGDIYASDDITTNSDLWADNAYITTNLETGGYVKVGTEVNRSAQGSADLIPIAYGVVQYDGTILSGSGNFTVSHPATGDFRITISGETFNSNDYTAIATARNTTAARIVTVGDYSGDLRIRIWNSSGSATDNTFHFVVYKP